MDESLEILETETGRAMDGDAFFKTTITLSLVLIAVALAGQFLILPTEFSGDGSFTTDILLGLFGAIPLFLVIYGSGPFNDFVFKRVAPYLSSIGTTKVVVLAVVVPIAEEWLFRGVLPRLIPNVEPMWAIVISNALFALCYGITKGAWVTMFLFGCYLSALYTAGSNDSIVRPIVAHMIFSVIMLPLLVNAYRRHHGLSSPEPSEQPTNDS